MMTHAEDGFVDPFANSKKSRIGTSNADLRKENKNQESRIPDKPEPVLWFDTEGRAVEAEFVDMTEDGVRIRLKSGKIATIRKEKMPPDQWEMALEMSKTPIVKSVPAKTGAIDLSAKTSSMSRDEITTWSTSWGSFNKTIDQKRIVELSARNRANHASTVVLEVLWLDTGSDGSGAPTGISSVSREEAVIQPNQEFVVKMAFGYSRDYDKYVALGFTERSGNGYGGWIARVADPVAGVIIAETASRPPLLRYSSLVPAPTINPRAAKKRE